MNAPLARIASPLLVDGAAWTVVQPERGLYVFTKAPRYEGYIPTSSEAAAIRRATSPALRWVPVSPRALYGLAWEPDAIARLRLGIDTVTVRGGLVADALDAVVERTPCLVVEAAVSLSPNEPGILLVRSGDVIALVVENTGEATCRVDLATAGAWLPDDKALDVSAHERAAGGAW